MKNIFKKIPTTWEIRKLPDVLFFQEGPGVRKWQFRESGVKLLNVRNINNGVLDLSTTNIYLSEDEAYGKYKHFLVDEDDLLIASSGIVVDNFHNKIAFATKEHLPLCMNTSTIRFKVLDKNVTNINYFRFFLKTNLFKAQLKRLITGSAQLNFGPSHLKKIKIPVPEKYEDQIRIATLLSRAEELIAKRKESIRLLDELVKSTFLEMFGDPVRNEKNFKKGKIRDLVDEVKYGTSKPASVAGKYPYLRMNNITYEGYWDFSDLKYIDVYDKDKEKYLIRKGDLVFNRTNSKELVGKTAVYDKDDEMIIAGYLIRVRVNSRANPWFIWGYLNSIHGKKRLFNLCRNIVGMANINANELQKIQILIPPIKLQSQFAQIVKKTESLKTKYQSSLQALENLYGSFSQRAFRGELDLSKIPIQHEVVLHDTLQIHDEASPTVFSRHTEKYELTTDGLKALIQDKLPQEFTFEMLHDAIEEHAAEENQYFETIKDLLTDLLQGKKQFLNQKFGRVETNEIRNEEQKQIFFCVNK